MTRMSESSEHTRLDRAANPARLLGVFMLARPVHEVRVPVALLIALLLGGCVIPPSLSVDNQDAGVNSPPSILAVRSDQASYSEPGPMTLVRRESMLNVQLLDTDVNDTLYVRVFVEYTVDDPKAARAFCRATPIQATRRSVTCDVGAVCTEADVASTVTKPLDMTIVVFDREPLETGEPAFQAMPEGGLSTSRFFFLNCVDAR